MKKKKVASGHPKKRDYEPLAEFRYTLRLFFNFSEEVSIRHDLTPQQYQALLAIEGFPGKNLVTIGQLAERLQTAHHSTVGLVNRLEKSGLVVRQIDHEDRRKVLVALTPKGLKILEELYLVHIRELRSVGPRLTKLLAEAIKSASQESSTR